MCSNIPIQKNLKAVLSYLFYETLVSETLTNRTISVCVSSTLQEKGSLITVQITALTHTALHRQCRQISYINVLYCHKE